MTTFGFCKGCGSEDVDLEDYGFQDGDLCAYCANRSPHEHQRTRRYFNTLEKRLKAYIQDCLSGTIDSPGKVIEIKDRHSQ